MNKWTLGQVGKTNPIQTQFKANSKPIQTQYKPNFTSVQKPAAAVLRPLSANEAKKIVPRACQFARDVQRSGNKEHFVACWKY